MRKPSLNLNKTMLYDNTNSFIQVHTKLIIIHLKNDITLIDHLFIRSK